MSNKTLQILLEEANQAVPCLSYEETKKKIGTEEVLIIDVREESEVLANGVIKNAIHIPRGLIEFKLPEIISIITENTSLLLYCAGGYRSALAAKTLKDLGINNVFNIGGYDSWIENGGEIQTTK